VHGGDFFEIVDSGDRGRLDADQGDEFGGEEFGQC